MTDDTTTVSPGISDILTHQSDRLVSKGLSMPPHPRGTAFILMIVLTANGCALIPGSSAPGKMTGMKSIPMTSAYKAGDAEACSALFGDPTTVAHDVFGLNEKYYWNALSAEIEPQKWMLACGLNDNPERTNSGVGVVARVTNSPRFVPIQDPGFVATTKTAGAHWVSAIVLSDLYNAQPIDAWLNASVGNVRD